MKIKVDNTIIASALASIVEANGYKKEDADPWSEANNCLYFEEEDRSYCFDGECSTMMSYDEFMALFSSTSLKLNNATIYKEDSGYRISGGEEENSFTKQVLEDLCEACLDEYTVDGLDRNIQSNSFSVGCIHFTRAELLLLQKWIKDTND